MKKSFVLWIMLGASALSGCGSKESETRNLAQANASGDNAQADDHGSAERAQLLREVSEVQGLLGRGDSAACVHPLTQAMVRKQLIPEKPTEAQLRSHNQQTGENIQFTPDAWDELAKGFGSFDNIAMTGMNDQTKQMTCGGLFSANGMQLPIIYAIQPSADHNDVLIRVGGAAMEQIARMNYFAGLMQAFKSMQAVSVSQQTGNEQFSVEEQNFIAQYGPLSDICQGETGEKADAACAKRHDLMKRMRDEFHICFGRNGQVSADYDFHRCDSSSL